MKLILSAGKRFSVRITSAGSPAAEHFGADDAHGAEAEAVDLDLAADLEGTGSLRLEWTWVMLVVIWEADAAEGRLGQCGALAAPRKASEAKKMPDCNEKGRAEPAGGERVGDAA